MIIKIAKIGAVCVVGLLGLLVALPMLFPDKITNEVKQFANQKLNGELNFKEARLSFFDHFPALTLTLTGFTLKGSAPFKNENLVASNEISLGIHLGSLLFDKAVKINEIYISDARVNVLVNQNGQANYNVYIAEPSTTSPQPSSTSISLEKIDISNAHLTYSDQSVKVLVDAQGFNYLGKGNLSNSVFDLTTKAHIDSFDFNLEGEDYLIDKKIDADLITKVNTNSLSFVFEHNNLHINRLPVNFKGSFDFLKNGYQLDFKVETTDSKLGDVFTAFPPQYIQWLEKTDIKGNTDLLLTLKGKYIVAEKAMPNLACRIKLRDGYVAYDKAPYAASNIFLDVDAQLPSLHPDSVKLKIDSLFFNVGKDYFKGIIHLAGLNKPTIKALVQSKLDLTKLNRALGIRGFDVRGLLNANLKANGTYDVDSHQFPVAAGTLLLQNGYLKTPYYPHAIERINLQTELKSPSGQFKDLQVTIPKGGFLFEGKPFELQANFQNFDDIAYNIHLNGEIDVAKVYQVFAQEGLSLDGGYINADLSLKGTQSDATAGRYQQLDNKGTLILRNIQTRSAYLPFPFVIQDGVFRFHQNQMDFSNFKALYGKSDFTLNGQMQNVINYALSNNAVLKGNFRLDSKYIDVDEFRAGLPTPDTTQAKATASPSGVVMIPPTLDFTLNANAKQVLLQGLPIKDLKGKVQLNKGRMTLNEAGFSLIGTTVAMNGSYSSLSPQKASFDYAIQANDFDIKRAYQEVSMFREMVTSAATAEGIISLDYKVSGKLDQAMQPIYPSLVGGGVLKVKDVKMKGFKLMNLVSKTTNKEDIANPNLKEVDIKTTIKNNLIRIERFKFKVAGFRPRIEGTTSFDGRLSIKMRLGLPPLGIIGIPLTITGTQTNPKVKLGKGEDIEETKEEEAQE
ncbi:MAG: AsmA-like C-terminal region-containing protein [Spirosomataceae bacterium]